jgi:hypothetical protein
MPALEEGLEPVSFGRGTSEDERIVPAEWVSAAIGRRVRVEISNTVLSGSFNLRSAAARESVSSLVNWEFKQLVDFSCSEFERTLDLSSSTMDQGIIFRDASFKMNLCLYRTSSTSFSIKSGTTALH